MVEQIVFFKLCIHIENWEEKEELRSQICKLIFKLFNFKSCFYLSSCCF